MLTEDNVQPAITPEEFRAWMALMRATTVRRAVGLMCTPDGGHCALGLLGLLRGYTLKPKWTAQQWVEPTASRALWDVQSYLLNATSVSVFMLNDYGPYDMTWSELADKIEAVYGSNLEKVESYYANR
jgi:hypothetical protein